jgi:hypothetical protein
MHLQCRMKPSKNVQIVVHTDIEFESMGSDI